MTLKQKISAWIALSLILQLAVLFYIDYYFLGGSGNVITQTQQMFQFGSYKLPNGASNIKVSHDAVFVSFNIAGKLNFADIKSKKDVYQLEVEGYALSFYKWLPDRNRVIAIFGTRDNKSIRCKVYAYDCDNKTEMKIQEINDLPSDCKVEDIRFSTLTNIIYLSMRCKDGPILYRIGIMGDKTRVYPRVKNFANLQQCNLKDIVLYEDPRSKNIYVQEGPEAWTVTLKKGAYLIGIDMDDNIYIAEDDQGKCSTVRHGKLSTKFAEWNSIDLGTSISPQDIIFQYNGEVFIKDEKQNFLQKVSNGSKTVYTGELLELHDDFIVSLDKGKIKIVPLNV